MHEASIAESLIEQVLDLARLHRLQEVTRVHVEVGVQRLVVPEALELAFQAASEETLAAGARLDLTEVAIRARCQACGNEYDAEIDDYTCPSCGRAQAELIAGDDIVLVSLEGNREDEHDHRQDRSQRVGGE